MTDPLFSRERLAGYDPERLEQSAIAIAGCGAVGNNVAQALALVGVGELRFIDPDVVEPSNLPRSPLFDASRLSGKRQRHKARECAVRALAISHARTPVTRSAVARVEALGAGAFLGASAIVAAVDSLPVRARFADLARLLGVPLIELGFSGSLGHVSVWPRSARRGDACWRCAHPSVQPGGVGCGLYARQAAASGLVPATQPLAGTIGSLAAMHVIEALHDRFPLGGRMVHLDLLGGRSRVVEIVPDPLCPGVHRSFGAVRELPVRSDASAGELLAAARAFVKDPVLQLSAGFVVEAPCRVCGASVPIGRPDWAVTEAPECRECPDVPQLGGAGVITASEVRPDDELAERRLEVLGFAPADIAELTDRATGERHAVRLAGGLDDLYAALRRERNEGRKEAMRKTGAMDAQSKERNDGEDADQSDLPPPPGLPRVRRGGGLGDDGPGRP